MPGANTRMTETGAVNWPTLRQTPQLRLSSLSFSTSAIRVPPVPAPLGALSRTITTGPLARRPLLSCFARSVPAGKPHCASPADGLRFYRIRDTSAVTKPGPFPMAKVLEKPELLAHAGDEESLRAAVAAGADAVYFGLRGGFNARARADNFAAADLPRIYDFLHSKGVQGFVTFNTLVFDKELPVAEQALADIASAGADAILVQDLGIARLAREVCPGLPLHASTQMAISSAEAAEIAKSLGITRIVLPRELSVDEIRAMAARTDLELE